MRFASNELRDHQSQHHHATLWVRRFAPVRLGSWTIWTFSLT
jgi:hypothetical protein